MNSVIRYCSPRLHSNDHIRTWLPTYPAANTKTVYIALWHLHSSVQPFGSTFRLFQN